MYSSSKKIQKDKDVEPTEFEQSVAQALIDLEDSHQELKSDLKDLYINSANIMDWMSSDKNNVCAFLGPISKDKNQVFAGVIEFLRRSRIVYAISEQHIPYRDHLRQFYHNAVIDCEVFPSVIRSKINDRDVIVSEQLLREELRFNDAQPDPIQFDSILIRGCFLRMKYNKPVTEKMLHKAHVCPTFKYLCHVVIQCLGPRRGGFEEIRETVASAIVALVLNKPFNFSGMIMEHLKEMIIKKTTEKPYLMYPRFLQMLIDRQLPDLPKNSLEIITLEHMKESVIERMLTYRGQAKENWPKNRRLFGHLSNESYRAPEGNKWRHDDSDSEDDILVMRRTFREGDNVGRETAELGSNVVGSSSQPAETTETTTHDDVFDTEILEVGEHGLSQVDKGKSKAVETETEGVIVEEETDSEDDSPETRALKAAKGKAEWMEQRRLREDSDYVIEKVPQVTDIDAELSSPPTKKAKTKGGRLKRKAQPSRAKSKKKSKHGSLSEAISELSPSKTTAAAAAATTKAALTANIPRSIPTPVIFTESVPASTSQTTTTTSSAMPSAQLQSQMNEVVTFMHAQAQENVELRNKMAMIEENERGMLEILAQTIKITKELQLSNQQLVQSNQETMRRLTSVESRNQELQLANTNNERRIVEVESENRQLKERLDKLLEDRP